MNRATFFKTLIGLPTALAATKALPAKEEPHYNLHFKMEPNTPPSSDYIVTSTNSIEDVYAHWYGCQTRTN